MLLLVAAATGQKLTVGNVCKWTDWWGFFSCLTKSRRKSMELARVSLHSAASSLTQWRATVIAVHSLDCPPTDPPHILFLETMSCLVAATSICKTPRPWGQSPCHRIRALADIQLPCGVRKCLNQKHSTVSFYVRCDAS